MNVRQTMGVLHLFSIKIIFYDKKMDLRLFYFHVTIYGNTIQIVKIKSNPNSKTIVIPIIPFIFIEIRVLIYYR